jgi:nitrate reductase NapD
MSDGRDLPLVDRRKFINGRWAVDVRSTRGTVEIASILVQTRSERLDSVAASIEALDGAQIYSRDPKGKLVVVLEAPDTGTIGATLSAISALPHVLTAALVFQGSDAD